MRGKIRFALRLFLGFVFLTAGMGKLTHGHFPGFIGPIQLEDELAKHHLGLYGRFIALSQVTIGWLLLSQRFALLGTIMLVPMLANILMVTIALEWRGTPCVNAFLLALNLGLLWLDRGRLLCLLDRDTADLTPPPAGSLAWGAAEWLWLGGAAAVVLGGAFGWIWWPAAYLGVALAIGIAVSSRRLR